MKALKQYKWNNGNLSDIANITMGQSPPGSSYNDTKDGIGLINGPTEFTNKYPVVKQWTTKPTKLCKIGDILLCVRGSSTGRMNIADGEYCIGRGVASIRAKKEKAETSFIYYTLNYKVNQLLQKTAGSTFPNLSSNELKEIIVGIPPFIEQQKIASILSTWDKAIELKEKLIEQKKEQKKGLMQKLLTGEVRLPGFDREWKEVRLGSVLKERKETGYDYLELLAITSKKGVVRRTEVDIKDNSSEDKSKYKRILPNDIGYNTMRMWQGVSGVSKYEGIVSPAYTILTPTEKVNPEFIGYLFKHPKMVNLFKRHSQGLVSDTLNLKYENFKVIKVVMPLDIEEQKRISEVLLCIDKEIEALQRNVAALISQKRGLMQSLLTGKVRVKV